MLICFLRSLLTINVKKSLEAATITWQVQNHSLFDFNSSNRVKARFRLSENCRIVRKGNLCSLSKDEGAPFAETLLRVQVSGVNGERWTVESEDEQEGLWTVVNGMKHPSGHKGTLLSPGDVLRLGRTRLQIKALSLDGTQPFMSSSLQSPVPVSIYHPSPAESTASCRICLSDLQDVPNPLVSICACDGSMKFVHLRCIQEWIRTRLDLNEVDSLVTTYHWRPIDCELCKCPFPAAISIYGETKPLVDMRKPGSPYIVLEELSNETNLRDADLHVVSMVSGSEISIGRSPQCNVVLKDISISRLHCGLRLTEIGFFLDDRKSKFGTVKKTGETRVSLEEGTKFQLQINRTLISLRVRRPWRLPHCCRCFFPVTRVVPEPSLEKQISYSHPSLVITSPHPQNEGNGGTVEHLPLESTSGIGYELTGQAGAEEERSQLIT